MEFRGYYLDTATQKALCSISNPDVWQLYLMAQAGNSLSDIAHACQMDDTRYQIAKKQLLESSLAQNLPAAATALGKYILTNETLRNLYLDAGTLLGKTININDFRVFLRIHINCGLSSDAILELLQYVKVVQWDNYPDRTPLLKTLEETAYAWAGKGITTKEAITSTCREYIDRIEHIRYICKSIGLGDRSLFPEEKNYICRWIDCGHEDEVIFTAYARCLRYKHHLIWAYIDKILSTWHMHGIHTIPELRNHEAIQRGQRHPRIEQNQISRDCDNA